MQEEVPAGEVGCLQVQKDVPAGAVGSPCSRNSMQFKVLNEVFAGAVQQRRKSLQVQ